MNKTQIWLRVRGRLNYLPKLIVMDFSIFPDLRHVRLMNSLENFFNRDIKFLSSSVNHVEKISQFLSKFFLSFCNSSRSHVKTCVFQIQDSLRYLFIFLTDQINTALCLTKELFTPLVRSKGIVELLKVCHGGICHLVENSIHREVTILNLNQMREYLLTINL